MNTIINFVGILIVLWIVQYLFMKNKKSVEQSLKKENLIGEKVFVPREQFPDVEVNLYRYDSEEPVGLVVVAHGGALINGDADMTDSFCDTLRNDCKCCVVSINYTKLGQQKPPYQQQEIIDVTQYFMKNASSYDRIFWRQLFTNWSCFDTDGFSIKNKRSYSFLSNAG